MPGPRKRHPMKILPCLILAAAVAALPACTSRTTTEVTNYDASGNPTHKETTTTTRNQVLDSARELGNEVKDGVVTGYEWTKDKTVKGYHWVKDSLTETGSE